MTDAALIGGVTAPEVHVMTYNIRRRVSGNRPGSPDRWATRKVLVERILAAEQPTIVGAQEALADQADFVAEALGSRYRWVGDGRDPSGRGEKCPIYYDAERLDLTGWRQRALSSTPDHHGSRSWGNVTRRILVSAEFTDVETGTRLFVFNTHLDHLSRRSRLHSAHMIVRLARAATTAEPDAAIVVMGDFNADESSPVYQTLIAGGTLHDAWEAAAERVTPPFGTFSNYRGRRPGGRRIDHILVGGAVEVTRTGINTTRFDGRAASDHEPVQTVLRAGSATVDGSRVLP
ncbi:endonuclease/exonuclease/phosphatase family protein [Agromyces sp. SYSU K20354]|uniref:endonuclease/exonuclease/phosphatase family protein n=1 Tax=Agromyces cavernae TaxID=2898659 RepID=UPI001E2FE4D5|nr:endonuclease/exonuclease/phosphatase family protein [Agromyces cavernae]MCD2442905.1 endonuclease/exonuclease/phosphatase family protein [Agromyces cavernae]